MATHLFCIKLVRNVAPYAIIIHMQMDFTGVLTRKFVIVALATFAAVRLMRVTAHSIRRTMAKKAKQFRYFFHYHHVSFRVAILALIVFV